MSLLLLLLVPLTAAAGVLLLRRHRGVAATIAVGGLVATLVAGVWAAATEPSAAYAWSAAIELSLRVEGFGRVMVVLVPLIAAPIVAYAAVSEPEGVTRLLVLMLGFVAAMLLLVVAADFVTLLIGWELIGAASWALIAHGWRDRPNVEAATQAFLTTRLGDLGLYAAAGATLAATGSFAFEGLGAAASPWREIVAGGVLLAVAAKSAQLPFSPWLFAAMVGPTPVSALLHSATLVAAGAYLLVRLAPLLEAVAWFAPLVAIVGLVTALGGSVVAIVQDQAKRALAASTSAQYGLMFVAVGAGSTAAAGAQLVTHAAFKSLLFLAAGIAIHAAGTASLGRMRLGRALPVVAAGSALGALALAGVPPLGGAWSKEAVVASAVEIGGWLAAGALLASFMSAAYAGRYQLLVFGRGRRAAPLRRPTRVELGAIGVLAMATILLSVLWLPSMTGLVEQLTGGTAPAGASSGFFLAVVLIGVALGAVVALERRGRLLDLGLPAPVRAGMANWLGMPRLTSGLVVRPTLRVSMMLARADDRVVDAGVRLTARVARRISALLTRGVEISVDGLVTATAAGTMRVALASQRADDQGVDGAVEATGRGIGFAGHQSRRLQTGLSHHYLAIAAAGFVAIAVILAAVR